MREMSSEMATLLKSKKMIGENRATHEIIVGDSERIILNPFTHNCLRGADGIFDKGIYEDLIGFYYGSAGGGDFVDRVDGKILLTYMKDRNVMLSILDSEDEILYKHNQGSSYEWIFYIQPITISTTGQYNHSTLIKLRNGKILLLVTDRGNYNNNSPCKVLCYRSDNGLGTDFILISTLFEFNDWGSYTNHIVMQHSDMTVGKPIELLTGRIIMPMTLPYGIKDGYYGNYLYQANYVAYSDNGGLTWIVKSMFPQTDIWTNLNREVIKSFGVFDDGNTRQIVAIQPIHTNIETYHYLIISTDDGETWNRGDFTEYTSEENFYRKIDFISYFNGFNYYGYGEGNTGNFVIYSRPKGKLIPTDDRLNIEYWDGPLTPQFGDEGSERIIGLDSGKMYIVGTSQWGGASISSVNGIDAIPQLKKIQAKSIAINRTNGMSSSLNIEFDNKDGVLAPDKAGEYEQVLWPNKEIIIKQGYGNELIQTYKGLIDTVDMGTFPQSINLSARDNLKKALDQTVSTILGEHVLTFVGMQVENMFTSLANMAGLPLGVVEETNIAVAEKTFSWESYGDAFSWLSELVGFEVVCDEEGLTHFRKQQIPTTPPISYEFIEGEDIISLGYTINDGDLYREIIVHGKKTVIIDEKEVDEVIEFKKVFSAANYWGLLAQKILKIDAPEATTLSECEQIALKAEYLMISRARIVRFQSIGIPHLQVGDFIQVTESSTTISEVYRITDLSTNQDSNTYTMDITCYWYSAEGVI